MAPMTAAVMNAVGHERAGSGSAMTNTSREVGGVFGIALLGTILTTRLRAAIEPALAGIGLDRAAARTVAEAAGTGRSTRGCSRPRRRTAGGRPAGLPRVLHERVPRSRSSSAGLVLLLAAWSRTGSSPAAPTAAQMHAPARAARRGGRAGRARGRSTAMPHGTRRVGDVEIVALCDGVVTAAASRPRASPARSDAVWAETRERYPDVFDGDRLASPRPRVPAPHRRLARSSSTRASDPRRAPAFAWSGIRGALTRGADRGRRRRRTRSTRSSSRTCTTTTSAGTSSRAAPIPCSRTPGT